MSARLLEGQALRAVQSVGGLGPRLR